MFVFLIKLSQRKSNDYFTKSKVFITFQHADFRFFNNLIKNRD